MCEVGQALCRFSSTLQGFIEITYTHPWDEEYNKLYLCSYNDKNHTVTGSRVIEHQPENSGQE